MPLHDLAPGGSVIAKLFDFAPSADVPSFDTGATIPPGYVVAITRITIDNASGNNIKAGSRVTIYGMP